MEDARSVLDGGCTETAEHRGCRRVFGTGFERLDAAPPTIHRECMGGRERSGFLRSFGMGPSPFYVSALSCCGRSHADYSSDLPSELGPPRPLTTPSSRETATTFEEIKRLRREAEEGRWFFVPMPQWDLESLALAFLRSRNSWLDQLSFRSGKLACL